MGSAYLNIKIQRIWTHSESASMQDLRERLPTRQHIVDINPPKSGPDILNIIPLPYNQNSTPKRQTVPQSLRLRLIHPTASIFPIHSAHIPPTFPLPPQKKPYLRASIFSHLTNTTHSPKSPGFRAAGTRLSLIGRAERIMPHLLALT